MSDHSNDITIHGYEVPETKFPDGLEEARRGLALQRRVHRHRRPRSLAEEIRPMTGAGDKPIRLRTGIARFDDGWNVVVEVDGVRSVYDPTCATEDAAELLATEAAKQIRWRLERDGHRVV